MDYTIGVSVGARSDRSAASVVRVRDDKMVECVHLQVWQPGTPPTQMLADVVNIAETILKPKRFEHTERGVVAVPRDNAYAVLDVTVAGAAVGSIFVTALGETGAGVDTFVITAGTQSSKGRVPKRDLASVMWVLLEKRLFTYSTQLEHAATLRDELPHFKITNTSGRDDEIDWRNRPHDDLVIATALACWYMQNYWQEVSYGLNIWDSWS